MTREEFDALNVGDKVIVPFSQFAEQRVVKIIGENIKSAPIDWDDDNVRYVNHFSSVNVKYNEEYSGADIIKCSQAKNLDKISARLGYRLGLQDIKKKINLIVDSNPDITVNEFKELLLEYVNNKDIF